MAKKKKTDEDEAPEDTAPAAPDMRKWKLFAIVSLVSLIADQATKIWARASLPVGPTNCQGNLDVVDALVARKCVGMPVSVIENYWD